MQFYFRENDTDLKQLYYPVSDQDFEFIITHQYKIIPPRFFSKKIFCPLLNRSHAMRVAAEPANWLPGTQRVHILRFLMKTSDLLKYSKDRLDNRRARIVVAKEQLSEFNKCIVGYIERVDTCIFENFC